VCVGVSLWAVLGTHTSARPRTSALPIGSGYFIGATAGEKKRRFFFLVEVFLHDQGLPFLTRSGKQVLWVSMKLSAFPFSPLSSFHVAPRRVPKRGMHAKAGGSVIV